MPPITKSMQTGGKKKKGKKDKSKSWYKTKADSVFSYWIRNRDADDFGYVSCITCGKRKPWQEVDNGHYISRRYIQTRFDEQNCHAQCKGCNGFHAGMTDVYALQLLRRYGPNILEDLEKRKKIEIKETKEFYKSIISKYQ